MIYLRLFLTFLQIGAVSFGGGYAMISLIREKVLMYGWITESELLNMIAVAESTPGPIAVNMATFVGAKQGGVFGSLLATLGVVLPSFVIILLITAAVRGLLRYRGVQAFLGGVRPCAVGLIFTAAVTLALSVLLGWQGVGTIPAPDLRGLVILAVLVLAGAVGKKLLRKKISPILMILLSAGLGIILYG